MSLIAKSTIQEVNDRLDAIAVVQDYVRLEKKGGRWWGRCPFHAGGQEKTPSFKVDPDYKTYHCFGCGKGGGVISFVMEMDKLTFPEAIKNLARKSGIEIVYENGMPEEAEDNTHVEELFELYRRTSITFQHFLLKSQDGLPAYNYIKNRGITEEMIERFRLGFSPPGRDFLYKFLIGKGYSEDFLDKSGLFSTRYKGMSLFSGRLMFPISDRQGRIVAFGGRALPGAIQSDGKEPPKYINSPELVTYKKGQTLYAIDFALSEIRQSKTVYIVEGYMDVIALHQASITNAVAPLGTAFTDEQAKLLRRWAEKAVLFFDSDEAGQKAVIKTILTCRKNGLSCCIVMPQQAVNSQSEVFPVQDVNGKAPQADQMKDPADILQKFGPKVLNNIIKNSIIDFEYLINRGRSQNDVLTPEGKNRALAFLFPYLEALDSEIERDSCINAAADAFGVDRNAVRTDYTKRHTRDLSRQEVPGKPPDRLNYQQIRMNGELFTLIVVSVNPNLYPEFRKALEIREVEDPAAKELFVALEECYVNDESSIDDLLTRIKSEPLRSFIIDRGTSPEFKSGSGQDPRRLMEDGINAIRKTKLRRRLHEIGAQLRNCERGTLTDSVSIDELLAEKMTIDSQLRKLEGR